MLEVEDEDDNEEVIEDEDEYNDVEVVDTDVTVMMLVRFVRAGWPSFTHLLLTERGGEGEGEVKAQLHSGSVNDNDANSFLSSMTMMPVTTLSMTMMPTAFFYGDNIQTYLFPCQMSLWDKLEN